MNSRKLNLLIILTLVSMEPRHLVIFSTCGKFITKFNVLRCINLSETLFWTGVRGRIPITLSSMDCLFDFCGLVVDLVVHGFFTNPKNACREQSFDVDKTTIKICKNKNPISKCIVLH